MRVTEGVDLAVVVMIAAAGIPTHNMCIRTKLNHGKRTGGSGKSMTVKTGSDKRIYVLYLVFLFLYNLFSLASEKY